MALEQAGLLGPDVQLIHPLLTTPEERAIMKARGVSYSTSPQLEARRRLAARRHPARRAAGGGRQGQPLDRPHCLLSCDPFVFDAHPVRAALAPHRRARAAHAEAARCSSRRSTGPSTSASRIAPARSRRASAPTLSCCARPTSTWRRSPIPYEAVVSFGAAGECRYRLDRRPHPAPRRQVHGVRRREDRRRRARGSARIAREGRLADLSVRRTASSRASSIRPPRV